MISRRMSIGLANTFVAIGLLLSGCKSNNSAGPADPETVRRVRQQITASEPGAIVGVVIAIEEQGRPFAAIGDVPTGAFSEGETITFIDSGRKTLTQGVVRRVDDLALYTEWMKPAKGGRAPRVGDLAVRFK